MRYRPTPFSRQWHQFKNQSAALNQAIVDGTFCQWSAQKQERVKRKLAHAYYRLAEFFSPAMLRRVLAGAALVIGIQTSGMAQDFAPPAINPFNLAMPSGEYFANPTLIDLDDDGDLDLLTNQYAYYNSGFYYFENIGSSTTPNFGAPVQNPFNLSALPAYTYQFSTLGDLDGDGDYDLVGIRNMGTMYYYENVGTTQLASFAAPQINPFNFPGSPAIGDSMYLFPELADMDGDGDLDLFVGNVYDAKVRYFENTGSASNPAFPSGVSMPFNMPFNNYLYVTNLSTGDIDRDGDLDVMVSARYDAYGTGNYFYENRFYYIENIGTATAPDFDPITDVNPFGLVSVGYSLFFSELVDIDDDGDLDILSGAADTIPNSYNYAVNFYYFENISFPVGTEQVEANALQLFPNPATDRLYFNWNSEASDYQLEMFDAMGKAVLTKQITHIGMAQGIPIDNLASGMYLLRLTSEDKTVTKQFIKQ